MKVIYIKNFALQYYQTAKKLNKSFVEIYLINLLILENTDMKGNKNNFLILIVINCN